MCAIFAYLLPLALVALECIFLRKCVLIARDRGYSRMPRAVPALLMAASFVPILGWIAFLATLIVAIINLSEGDWQLIPSRFTRYWFDEGGEEDKKKK